MTMNVYSIKDNDVGSFNKPFYEPNDVAANRAVIMSLDNTMLKEFPASFALYFLGEFDEAHGRIKTQGEPRLVASISTLIQNRIQAGEGNHGTKKDTIQDITINKVKL